VITKKWQTRRREVAQRAGPKVNDLRLRDGDFAVRPPRRVVWAISASVWKG
jgi:hypothetical protein